MKNSVRVLSGFVVALGAGSACAAELEWETEGFKNPESVLFDATRERLYVSNIDGDPVGKDGNGFISLVSPDGAIIEAEWATGLDAPKGMALHDDRLYVSDIDQLVEIDVNSGSVVARYPASGAKFLNDVAADETGNVYVSDMLDDAIYRLADGTFEIWIQDGNLTSPNGLTVEGDILLVAAWGVLAEGFATETPGNLKAVSLETGKVTDYGDGTPVGNLDGIELDGQGNYLVTDWMNGGLFRIEASGKADLLIDLDQGSADLEYIESRDLAIIPMMNEGKLSAFRLK